MQQRTTGMNLSFRGRVCWDCWLLLPLLKLQSRTAEERLSLVCYGRNQYRSDWDMFWKKLSKYVFQPNREKS